MRLLVIQHDHITPGGVLTDRFAHHGFQVDVHVVVPAERHSSPGVELELPAVDDYDVVMVLGSPWSVYDSELVGSWVEPELDALRRADKLGRPVLGVCFGGQMLAKALGGDVSPSPAPELGWRSVVSKNTDLIPEGPWFQWHFDRWSLPPESEEIAVNESGSQAFALRKNLALQFHPEATHDIVGMWISEGGAEQVEGFGIEPAQLLAVTSAREVDATQRALAIVDAFVEEFVHSDE